MDEDPIFHYDTDLDHSFTSCASITTTTTALPSSSSARSSLARSSLTLSFNDRLSTTTTATTTTTISSSSSLHHCKSDPHWSAIKTATSLSSDGKLHLRHLKLLRHLGTGNLGRVFLCRLRDCDETATSFALKVVDTEFLSAKKLSHVETEAQILSMLDHPFLPTLYAHIQVSHYTCLLIDYCPGGDLHALLRKQPGNRLSVQAVRFFAAEVLVALEYLHALGIVYRDLKPENILLRQDGHIMLSDFDLCFKSDVVPTFKTRIIARARSQLDRRSSRRSHYGRCFSYNYRDERESWKEQQEEVVVAEFVAEPTDAHSTCCVGTHEYLAPELVSGNGHGNGVDWWAFGVLMYELLYGVTPFKGGSKESTLRNIASTGLVRFPEHVADGEREIEEAMAEAKDLIAKLLVKDPHRRLGCTKGATDIKRHPFFDGIKWPLIRSYRPPEVRGLTRKSTRSHVGHVGSGSGSGGGSTIHHHIRRRKWWWWKGLSKYFMRSKQGLNKYYYYSKNSNHSNCNYYYYYVNSTNEYSKHKIMKFA